MLAKRIIGVVMIENGYVVRRVGWKTASIIGQPRTTIKFLQDWDVDEIFFINVGEKEDRDTMTRILHQAVDQCFIPITVGGGISSLEEASHFIKEGADKIVIGRNATKGLCQDICQKYGKQALTISVDENHEERCKELHNYEWSFGDLVINDKSRDGKAEGLNTDLAENSRRFTDSPIILMGGTRNYQCISEALSEECIDAVAVGNLFHFKEVSAKLAKQECKSMGVNVR